MSWSQPMLRCCRPSFPYSTPQKWSGAKRSVSHLLAREPWRGSRKASREAQHGRSRRPLEVRHYDEGGPRECIETHWNRPGEVRRPRTWSEGLIGSQTRVLPGVASGARAVMRLKEGDHNGMEIRRPRGAAREYEYASVLRAEVETLQNQAVTRVSKTMPEACGDPGARRKVDLASTQGARSRKTQRLLSRVKANL